MKAIVWTKYGSPDGLVLQELEKPIPKEGEVLIKVHATTVTAGDCEMRRLDLALYLSLPVRLYAGVLRPTRIRILGQEFAGEIEAVGQHVERWRVGDQVFGSTGFGTGTYAEYLCLPEVPGDMDGVMAIKPANMSYEEAAALPTGGFEALHFLRQANIQPGDAVLINGAGGSIGTVGVQLAKHWGAEVTAVDSAAKLEMLRSISADHLIDYAREDFTKSGRTYDVIFDVVGKSPFAASVRSLKEKGFYLIANPQPSKMIRGQWVSKMSSKTVISTVSSHKVQDLIFLKELVEAGKLKSIIDRCYPLEEMVEAHRYVETGQKTGNLVITL